MEEKPISTEPPPSPIPKIVIGCGAVAAVVVILCAAALFYVGSVAVRLQRDASRRIECVNNLRQMGLAVHNFHDTRRGLPPLVVGPDRASVFTQILPYCEQRQLYEAMDDERVGTSLGAPMLENWGKLTPSHTQAFGSISIWHCPSRRDRGVHLSESQQMPGPVSDYAAVMMTNSSQPTDWVNYWDPCKPEHIQHVTSMLRVAVVTGCPTPDNLAYRNARPRDTLARTVDGTSNTIIFGEKHIRFGEYRRCCGNSFAEGADGSVLLGGGNNRQFTIARSAYFPLTQEPTDFDGQEGRPDGGPLTDFGFGSHHLDIVLIALADGSVRPLSNKTSPDVLRGAAGVNDGKYFDFE